jgi:hypothetical protein
MRRAVSTAFAIALLAAAAGAEAQQGEESWLPEHMERALRGMLEGLKPTLDEALDYMRSFGVIDDPRHYEMPEVLPNGDIIIRRREDAPEFRPEAPDEPGEPAEELPLDPEDGIRT